MRSLRDRLTPAQEEELIAWATRALRGVNESHAFVAVLSDAPLNAARLEFVLQLGAAILQDKPILLPVPHGTTIPRKLEAVADRIVRYNPSDPESLATALAAALSELGIKRH